jgi:hypothetical protein
VRLAFYIQKGVSKSCATHVSADDEKIGITKYPPKALQARGYYRTAEEGNDVSQSLQAMSDNAA